MNSVMRLGSEGKDMDEVLRAHVYKAITNHKPRISYVEGVGGGGWFEIQGWEGQYFGYSSFSSNKGSWEGSINKSGQDEGTSEL